jgi:hypothetical protein
MSRAAALTTANNQAGSVVLAADGPPVTFVEVGSGGGYRLVAGGLTVLERVIRDLGKRGVKRVVVGGESVPIDRGGVPHGVAVEFAGVGAAPQSGQVVVRGDEIAGIRVVDEASRRTAEWALMKGLPKSHQGPTDALLNWRFSLPITRLLCKTSLWPNHITIFGSVFGLLACAIAAKGSWAALAIAGVMLQMHNVLDSCDGELARLRFQFTKSGAWLDNILDEVVDDLFVVVMGFVAGGPWVWVGLVGGGGRLLATAIQWEETARVVGSGSAWAFRYWFESYSDDASQVWNRKSIGYWLRAFGRRDTYCLVFMILCLFNLPQAVAAYALVPGGLTLVLMLLHVVLRNRTTPQS